MNNPIESTSEIYKELSATYENTPDKRERFQKCFDIVNSASYEEIHYMISMLKETRSLNPNDALGSGDLADILSSIILAFTGKTQMKHAFLLDILEEARERKR